MIKRKNMSTSFGNWLKDARRYAGLSSIELGDMMDISYAYVLMIENGQKPAPRKRIFQLADIFETDSDFLFEISHIDFRRKNIKQHEDDDIDVDIDTNCRKIVFTKSGLPPEVINLTSDQRWSLMGYLSQGGDTDDE